MNTSHYMLLIVLPAVMFNSCFAGTFSSTSGGKCSFPTWKCDCKLFYNCDTTNTGFPDADLGADPADVLKDLAPDDYPMQMPGKRWRRNVVNQRKFCERECRRRMNSFLCLDDTAYSRAAVCTKLQLAGVVAQGAANTEPCCEIFLQWGPKWCDDKWNESIFFVTCSGDTTSFPTGTVLVTPATCTLGMNTVSNAWCSGTNPVCGGSGSGEK